jgi:hypothetical protein
MALILIFPFIQVGVNFHWDFLQESLLADEEREEIKKVSMSGNAVGNNSSRLYEPVYELKTGKPIEATRGLDDRMNVNKDIRIRIANEVDGIQEEVELLASCGDEKCKEVLELLNYIRFEKSSEKEYPNGTRDKGRRGVNLIYFLTHKKAQEARLTEAEVVALRLYSTAAYSFMNTPLRDDTRHNLCTPCPLAATTHFATSGIKKMRALHISKTNSGLGPTALWRGMRNTEVAANFMLEGGTEFGLMSTTTELAVAVRYSLSNNSLLFKIVVSDFMVMGADLQWVSAFPGECEILYPPLTYLKPTGRTETVRINHNGQQLSFKVVEVLPHMA